MVMCPKCNGSLIRDYRSDEPPYCLQCSYVLIKVTSVTEGYFTRNRNYRIANAAFDVDSLEE